MLAFLAAIKELSGLVGGFTKLADLVTMLVDYIKKAQLDAWFRQSAELAQALKAATSDDERAKLAQQIRDQLSHL